MAEYAIYRITNKVTGRVYIGRSSDIRSRLGFHKRRLSSGRHTVPGMQSDYDQYGSDVFSYEVLHEGLPWHEAKAAEKRLIQESGNPYNRLSNPNYVHHQTVRAALRGHHIA